MLIGKPHRVAVLAYEGMAPFEFGVVVEVFGLARPELDIPGWYTVDVCAETPGVPMRMSLWLIDIRGGRVASGTAGSNTGELPGIYRCANGKPRRERRGPAGVCDLACRLRIRSGRFRHPSARS